MGHGSDSDDDRYLATIVKMDHTLGKLFDRLEQMGEMDKTLVIVTSDNGPTSMQLYYEKGHTAPGRTNHLRGCQGSIEAGRLRQPKPVFRNGHTNTDTPHEPSRG